MEGNAFSETQNSKHFQSAYPVSLEVCRHFLITQHISPLSQPKNILAAPPATPRLYLCTNKKIQFGVLLSPIQKVFRGGRPLVREKLDFTTLLSVSALYTIFCMSICISTMFTQNTTFISLYLHMSLIFMWCNYIDSLQAPETGNFSFFIASDDSSEFWISTNETKANATKILTLNKWTRRHEWNKYLYFYNCQYTFLFLPGFLDQLSIQTIFSTLNYANSFFLS